jgi:hypothetical protein
MFSESFVRTMELRSDPFEKENFENVILTLSLTAPGHIWRRLFIVNFLKKPLSVTCPILQYFKILEISIGLVWMQLAFKAKIYVITKALNIWPPRELT